MRNASICTAVLAVGLSASAMGAVVTDNNLSVQSLGSLTAGPAVGSASFDVTPGIYGVSATVASDGTGGDLSGYVIDAVSSLATLPVPLQSTDTLARTTWSRTFGNAYAAKLHSLVGIAAADSTLYYHLGIGRTSDGWKANYKWNADNLIAFQATGADGGNLVPNASFEDPSAAVFKTDNRSYGEYVDDPTAPHGGKVLKNTSTRDLNIASRWSRDMR